MMQFPINTFLAGELIFAEGDIGEEAYIIKRGSVEIFSNLDKRKIVLATFRDGAIIGEMALFLRDHRRTATAIALEDSEIISIDKENLKGYLDSSPLIISTLINSLVDRLYNTTRNLLNPPRLFQSICQMLHLLTLHGNGDILIDETVQTLSQVMQVETKGILEIFEVLEAQSLIDIAQNDAGVKMIRVIQPDTFLSRLAKIQHYRPGVIPSKEQPYVR